MALVVKLLELLISKGLISTSDVFEMADAALLKLEEYQSSFPEEDRKDFELARGLLDTLVKGFGDTRL